MKSVLAFLFLATPAFAVDLSAVISPAVSVRPACLCSSGDRCICGVDCNCRRESGSAVHVPAVAPTVSRSPQVQVLIFSAEWCGPCRKFARDEVPRLAADGWNLGAGERLQGVDFDASPDLVKRFGVESLPTAILVRDGLEVARSEGAQTAESIVQLYRLAGATESASNEADFQPTPYRDLWKTLEDLKLKSTDVFVDVGAGDGRAVIAAARGWNCRAIGIEMDPEQARRAVEAVAAAGLSDRVQIITADATKVDLSSLGATVGFVYLWPDTLEDLKPQLMRLDRFASFQHKVPGLEMAKAGDSYLWNKSKPITVSHTKTPVRRTTTSTPVRSVPVRQSSSSRVATWGGVRYSAPVCNSRGCTMCNSIRSQLGFW